MIVFSTETMLLNLLDSAFFERRISFVRLKVKEASKVVERSAPFPEP